MVPPGLLMDRGEGNVRNSSCLSPKKMHGNSTYSEGADREVEPKQDSGCWKVLSPVPTETTQRELSLTGSQRHLLSWRPL